MVSLWIGLTVIKYKAEKTVQKEIIDCIKNNNGYVVKVVKGNDDGINDLIACLPVDNKGLFISCEVKAERYCRDPLKQASARQKKHMQMVVEAKGISMCVASLEQFKEVLSEHYIYLK